MLLHLLFKPAVLLSALLFVGCGDKEPTSERPKPTIPAIEVTLGEITETSVTATLSLSNADKGYYVVLPAQKGAPTGYQLSKHTPLGEQNTITVDGLTRGSDYVFYAVATQGNVFGEVVSKPFKTDKTYNTLAAKGWTTTADKQSLFAEITTTSEEGVSGVPVITINDATKYQTIDGWGPAITGSSCYNLLLMTQSDRTALLREVFDPEEGMGYSFIRISIGCSDFSLTEYTCCDEKGIENWKFPELDERDLLPILKEIYAINPGVKIVAAPWTCPKWMKIKTGSNEPHDKWTSGRLNPDYYDDYATYFVKWVQYMESKGFPIYAVSPQNEPLNHGNSASLYMDWRAQRDFVGKHLGPAFRENGIKTQIWAYDHNFDVPDYVKNIYKSEYAEYFDGSAWHAYGGNKSVLSDIYKAAPEKGIYFTEQSIGTWCPNFGDNLMWTMREICIGTVNLHCKAVLFWNFLLDANRGPNRPDGGCTTCYGFVDFTDGGHKNLNRRSHYYSIAHMSKVAKTDAHRIASSISQGVSGVCYTAFLNPDGTHSLVLLNEGDTQRFIVQDGKGGSFAFEAPKRSVTSLIW